MIRIAPDSASTLDMVHLPINRILKILTFMLRTSMGGSGDCKPAPELRSGVRETFAW